MIINQRNSIVEQIVYVSTLGNSFKNMHTNVKILRVQTQENGRDQVVSCLHLIGCKGAASVQQ